MSSDSSYFGEWYYDHNCGRPYHRNKEWLDFFGMVAEQIQQKINPATVLDAGCAKGFLVETLRDRAIEAYGVDISEYAIENVYEGIKSYCWVGSVTQPFPKHYDLITLIEVVEHMPSVEASMAIKNICAHTDTVLFSSSPTDYSEATHFNLQQPEYWVREFGYHGFFHDLDFDARFLTTWAMLFRRKSVSSADVAFEYERARTQTLIENNDLRTKNNNLEAKLCDLEARLKNAEIVRVMGQSGDADEMCKELKLRIDELQNQEEALKLMNTALVIENKAIKESTSWKITQPLRKVKDLINKLNWR